ncbi:MarR family winged helix-turn-helix transcriptional regulator [Pseudonocardia acidicola]|uniref:MarR family transcriptional regulator n=1 Tax=Pseudonocardia acidicola TaxID=2724939 RepID=A0ABX1S9V5_9PSEU|nr:MarR family transcriptional regulator [Pseudonocardia acidicola]NMH97332.1 MarR family transcriptional regulator [Pseudonocardia acidicola]
MSDKLSCELSKHEYFEGERTMASGEDTELSVSEQVARSASVYAAELDPGVLQLTLMLYRTMSVFDRAHTAELSPHGLNLVQFNVISVLHRVGRPLTMGELAHAVSVRPANLTSVVDGLEKNSLVDRRLNPDDRRSFLVGLTPTGEEFLAGFLPGHWRYLQSLTSGLSPRQRKQLTTLLERLMRSVQEADAPAQPPVPAGPSTAAS